MTAFATPNQTVSAIDGRMYQSIGSLWHKQDRQLGIIPFKLRNVDVESEWFKSGYRLVMQGLVFPQPIPLFAVWRANNESESTTIVKEALKAEKLPITDLMLDDETFGEKSLGFFISNKVVIF